MRILRFYSLSADEYTLLCECAKQKPVAFYPLHERTLMKNLYDRKLIRLNRHANAYELSELGLTVLDSIVAKLPCDSHTGLADVFMITRK